MSEGIIRSKVDALKLIRFMVENDGRSDPEYIQARSKFAKLLADDLLEALRTLPKDSKLVSEINAILYS